MNVDPMLTLFWLKKLASVLILPPLLPFTLILFGLLLGPVQWMQRAGTHRRFLAASSPVRSPRSRPVRPQDFSPLVTPTCTQPAPTRLVPGSLARV